MVVFIMEGTVMKPTNNKIFDHVNKFIADSPYTMNTLKISFPYEYAMNVAVLNWHDVLFAIDQGFIDHRSAIEHAQIALEGDNYPQAVLDLACIDADEAVFPHSIRPYIDELADIVDEERKLESKDKIMYILLRWVYEHKMDYDSPLDISTIICDNFGFPESITYFAWRFSPMREPDLGSPEKNIARVFDYWRQFLEEQHEKWTRRN